MAKKKSEGGNGIVFIIGLVIVVIKLVSNFLNFSLLIDYGPSQYVFNIYHGHSDLYFKSKMEQKIYGEILSISDLQKKEPLAVLKSGNRFKFRGYKQKGEIIWVAAQVFEGSHAINGYFIIPGKHKDFTLWSSIPFHEDGPINNRYFWAISDKEWNSYRNNIEQEFRAKIFKELKINTVIGSLKIQEIDESDNFKIIPYFSSDNKAYYCSAEDFDRVEFFYENFLGGKFDVHFLQIGEYDYHNAKFVKGSIFEKIIGTWYFKIGLVIFVLMFIGKLVKSTPKCPSCNSKDFDIVKKCIISENYKHEKKNGDRDLRFKDNPLIRTWRLSFQCNKCSKTWKEEEEEQTNQEKSFNVIASKSKTKKQKKQKNNILETETTKKSSFLKNDMKRLNNTVNEDSNISSELKKEVKNINSQVVKISGDLTVGELKSRLKSGSAINVRIYKGNKFAPENSNLNSIGFNLNRAVNLKVNKQMPVGNFEKAFKKHVGITIQIENSSGNLADNNLSLAQVG